MRSSERSLAVGFCLQSTSSFTSLCRRAWVRQALILLRGCAEKIFIKIAGCALMATTLLVAGYSAGLLVQHKRDVRYEATVKLAIAMRLHKAMSVGAYDYVQRDAMCSMMDGAIHVSDDWDFNDLPFLLRDSLTCAWADGWHRAALAHMIGIHRAEPSIRFPIEIQPELAAFVPRTEAEQKVIDSYAKWDPVGR